MAKKINILCEQFFKMDGTESLFGGGERWLFDFVALLKKLHYNVECYQFSTKPWTKRYKQMVIKGLGNISVNPMNFQQDYDNGINKFYQLSEKADGIFLLSMNLSVIPATKPTLTVSHGLMFDFCEPGQKQNPIPILEAYKQWIQNCTYAISVDYNSIRVMQVYDRKTSEKMIPIINYVDLEKFKPNEKLNDEVFTVLYPRRLQWCRGYTFMMNAVDILREKYLDMKFIFCGRGNQMEENYFNSWLKKNPTNVEYMWKEMNDMPNVYKKATISVVPTAGAEGSSLSVLESLASGVPVVSTYIGGIPDIIQNNVNGLLIQPSSTEAIIDAVEYCYHNRDHLTEMRDNGLRMIRHFGKDRWETDITSVVKAVYGEP